MVLNQAVSVVLKSVDILSLASQTTDLLALNADVPHGKFMFTVLVAVKKLEGKTIRARHAQSIVIANRKASTTELQQTQIQLARERIAQGGTKAKVARDLDVSRHTGLRSGSCRRKARRFHFRRLPKRPAATLRPALPSIPVRTKYAFVNRTELHVSDGP